jgi:hypothetical protein
MSALRAALILILAGGAAPAFADQITCESHGGAAEACGTVQPRSSVRLVKQLSNTPCIEEQNWGLGPNRDSIWVSGGCRAVFDVQPPRNDPYSEAQYRDNELRSDESRGDEPIKDERHDGGSRYARADDLRANARDACIDRAASGQPFGPDQVRASDARWIGHGMFSVSLDTPDGPLTCTVDRDGNVRSIDR